MTNADAANAVDPELDSPIAGSEATPAAQAVADVASTDQDAQVPEFAEVAERTIKSPTSKTELLHGVSIPVWVELGRVEMMIGDLVQLGEGSVVRLDRGVGDTVDLFAQGVKLARGEVIVVDDHFAIRIREVLSGD